MVTIATRVSLSEFLSSYDSQSRYELCDGAADAEAPLSGQRPPSLCQIPIAQGVATVPTHVKQDDAVLEMLPFEWGGMGYRWEI